MNSDQRTRIVRDIVNHKIELVQVGGNSTISDDEIEEFQETIEELSDDDLESWWFSRVGEWVNSMRKWDNYEFRTETDTPKWTDEGFDSPAEWQFNKLLNGEPIDYGYVDPLGW